MAENIRSELKRRGVDKEVISSDGTCMVHEEFTVAQIAEARTRFPGLKVVSHPECTAEVAEAICKCSFLRPHLLARIGACAVLVKPESVKTLGKLLADYGFAIGKEVLLPAPAPTEKKK